MKESFAISSKHKRLLMQSSSGAVFYGIAKYVVQELNGSVFGVVLSNNKFIHVKTNSIKGLKPLLTSKYVKAEIGNSFLDCANELNANKYVFYVGLPCEISFLISFLNFKNVNCEKLITADLICHGAPNPIYWDQYIKEKFPSQKVESVNFRYKKPSWENFSIKLRTNKQKYKCFKGEDEYLRSFLRNYILLDSCYECKFKGENHVADITMGDFWGVYEYFPNQYSKRGTSLLILNNDKIKPILEHLKKYKIKKVDFTLSTFLNPAYNFSVSRPLNIDDFKNSVDKLGFIESVNKLIPVNKCKKRNYKRFFKLAFKKLDLFLERKKRVKNNPVGILTLSGYRNFGNRLQNYALRTFLSNNKVETINVCYDKYKVSISKFYFNTKYKLNNREKQIKKASLKSGEKNMFFRFSNKKRNDFNHLNKIIVGSDQVWNAVGLKEDEILFNLCFLNEAKTNQKLYSYSASIGADIIPNKYEFLFKKALSNFVSISVREDNAKKLLDEIGIASTTTCDPVLLLSSVEWDESIDRYKSINIDINQYNLVYCLKEKPEITDNTPIINPLDRNSSFYNSNHFDFVNLIKHADTIITDSFHAVMFSIIYKKKVKFVVRESMIKRFDSIFKLFGIESYNNKIIDFSKLNYHELNVFISKSKKYLINIIKN